MAGKIFISYRRNESAWAARAVFERLRQAFRGEVFIDLEGISPGIDFIEVIDRHLDGCNAMMAMIGPQWLQEIQARSDDHDAHLQDADDGQADHVRLELARALSKSIPVVPVLIDGADLPAARVLPAELKPLARRHAVKLPWEFFEAQMDLLEKELRKVLPATPAPTPPSPPQPATAAKGGVPPAQTTPPAPVSRPAVNLPKLQSWMSDQGKDHYGHWAEFTVKGVVQRLRWIEPGEFWMGSTEAERKRFAALLPKDQQNLYDDEAPRHRVSLTQGYWLADTACTQALWQTVVGDNPSSFTDDLNLPIEQVNWDDVTQKFLPALSRQLGGADLRLPTEAQWEYACRAGTETAYAFGDLITPKRVNYDAYHPPLGSKMGLYRERTVPVKALPANAWGLYQMHGNVWEWCADAKRTYSAAPIADPDGGQGPSQRALRGGSWFDRPDIARSACRGGWHRVIRDRIRGFRLSLTSPGPEARGRP